MRLVWSLSVALLAGCGLVLDVDPPETDAGAGPVADAGPGRDGGNRPDASGGSCATASAGDVCRPARDDCDIAEMCDGSSDECPEDARRPAGGVCRPSAGPCDAEETCDTTGCPADEFLPVGPCTRMDGLVGVCMGSGADCVPCIDGEACTVPGYECVQGALSCAATSTCVLGVPLPAGTICHPSTDECDEPEYCDGVSGVCPVDALFPDGTECRPAFGECDVPETCDGMTDVCPMDDLRLPGAPCLGGACDGSSVLCDIRTRVIDDCARNEGSCATDADCHVTGCDDELCSSDAGGSSMCGCVMPKAACGCVGGVCAWYL